MEIFEIQPYVTAEYTSHIIIVVDKTLRELMDICGIKEDSFTEEENEERIFPYIYVYEGEKLNKLPVDELLTSNFVMERHNEDFNGCTPKELNDGVIHIDVDISDDHLSVIKYYNRINGCWTYIQAKYKGF